jgi:tetratricopeptide (TPR) repeat protein
LRGDYSRASELVDQSQALLRDLDDQDLAADERLQYLLTIALADNVLGQVRLARGDHAAATRLFTDALTAASRAQDRITILVSRYDLALSSQGDLSGAAGHLKEGLALAAEAGDQASVAYYLEGLAAVAGQQDDPQRAVRLFTAADSLLEANGSGWLDAYVPRVAHDDAVLAALRTRLGDAAFQQAQAWGRSAGSTPAREYALGQGRPGRIIRSKGRPAGNRHHALSQAAELLTDRRETACAAGQPRAAMPEGCTDLNCLRGPARRELAIDRRCRLSDLAAYGLSRLIRMLSAHGKSPGL